MNFHSSFSTTPNFSKSTPHIATTYLMVLRRLRTFADRPAFGFFVMNPKSYPRVFSINIEHLCWFLFWRICYSSWLFKVTDSKQYPLVSEVDNVIRSMISWKWSISKSICCYQEDKILDCYSFISWVFFHFW